MALKSKFMTNPLATALAITAQAFEHSTDKAGQPYMLHCLRVMNNLHTDDQELQAIAVMHDLLEDTELTFGALTALGFSQRVVSALILLKHDQGVPYDSYIKLLAYNKDAVAVKKADLKDNSDITRLKGLTKKDIDRMEKYHRAWVYLSKL